MRRRGHASSPISRTSTHRAGATSRSGTQGPGDEVVVCNVVPAAPVEPGLELEQEDIVYYRHSFYFLTQGVNIPSCASQILYGYISRDLIVIVVSSLRYKVIYFLSTLTNDKQPVLYNERAFTWSN